MNIEHEKTKEILNVFEELSKVPRCSKNEEKIRKWLENWAEEHNFDYRTDEAGNILIEVPASEGYENATKTIIQGHLDMVCEKTPNSDHDFSKDPIEFVYEDGWLTANKTTLGADNGIAIAMALVAALDKSLKHPPLELLFTVDEETGLVGATALKPDFVKGKILLNLDSEDEGIFTIGCAGGKHTTLTIPIEYQKVPENYKPFKILVGGIRGGHSGIDIDQQRANAIKILARALYSLKGEDIRIASIKGGTAHNAIPRDAESIIFFPEQKLDSVKDIIKNFEKTVKSEYTKTDPKMKISIEEIDSIDGRNAATEDSTLIAIDSILALPHGVEAMSKDIEGLVETSTNLANANTENGNLKILASQRSSVMSKLDALCDRIESIGRLAGGTGETGKGYPSWEPNLDSPLLEKCKKIYKNMFNKDPVIEIIHAGLECGIIGSKYPGMDMISIGPTLENPHSPDERIEIKTIGMVWDFLVEILKSID